MKGYLNENSMDTIAAARAPRLNEDSMDTIASALAYTMGIEPPACAAAANETLVSYIDGAFGGEKADRVVMYNPDAVAEWIYEKYPMLFTAADAVAEVKVPLCTVMPSVTPVCFGTMYTGAQPKVHGIQKYEKPVIKIDTLFDALIRAGKRPVIIAQTNCSLAKIYLEREMDYFIYPTCEEVNAKAVEVLLSDEYDFVVIYNGNYDATMHKTGPESIKALSELRMNTSTYAMLYHIIKNHYQKHNTLLGFAMDHGCHEIDEGAGSHGLDMEEDLNVVHLYRALKREC